MFIVDFVTKFFIISKDLVTNPFEIQGFDANVKFIFEIRYLR